jgi:hypothetical protein
MSKNFSLLIVALTEDFLLLLVLSLLAFASIEVLIPELALSRLPLALLFFIFFLLLTLYLSYTKKLGVASFSITIPKALAVLLYILLTVALFISLRAFGLWAALVQVVLLGTLLYIIIKK